MKSKTLILVSTLLWPMLPACAQLDRTGPPSAQNILLRDSHRLELGEASFQQLCTGCHGRGGEGGQGEGQGPNLATNWEVRRAKDADLYNFINKGVTGTAMPAFNLPEEKIWELAAFVRSLNAPADSVPVQGDLAAGAVLFSGKGKCSGCHMIHGQGGYLGPDLSNVGASRRLSELRDALAKPSPTPSLEFQPVLLTDAQGHSIRAIAKHSSPWSVQALDEKGNLHFLRDGAVRKLAFQKVSWMPSAAALNLSSVEVTNLVAFLSRQSARFSGERGISN